jgi:hypothetical protein
MVRQVGLVRGTWWMAGSSAVYIMPGRASQRVFMHRWWLSQGTKQDRVGHPKVEGKWLGILESWCGEAACALHSGFVGLGRKINRGRFLYLSLKTKEAWCGLGVESRCGLKIWGGGHVAWSQRLRWGGAKLRWKRVHPMWLSMMYLSYPLEGVYLILCCRSRIVRLDLHR